nr:MAG TPA: hypothetical protein [Caudoviricetes sp.]
MCINFNFLTFAQGIFLIFRFATCKSVRGI